MRFPTMGLMAWNSAEKDAMRDLALRGGPWSDDERLALTRYCEKDVVALAKLLPPMLRHIDLKRALFRGRYMAAVATMENTGTPIDTQTLDRLREKWATCKTSSLRTSTETLAYSKAAVSRPTASPPGWLNGESHGLGWTLASSILRMTRSGRWRRRIRPLRHCGSLGQPCRNSAWA